MIALQIRPNSRQIPGQMNQNTFPNGEQYAKEQKLTEVSLRRLYDDLLYGYLQSISLGEKNDNGNIMRYLTKKQINFSAIGEILDLNRKTVAKRFKILEGLGLIYKDENDGSRYILHILNDDISALVPNDVLTVLVNMVHPRAIAIYSYFLKNHYAAASKGHDFFFTKKALASFLGICTTNRRDDIVGDCLKLLAYLKLIEYDVIEVEGPLGIERKYKLTQIYNTLPKQLTDEKAIRVTRTGWQKFDKGEITWDELRTSSEYAIDAKKRKY